MNSHRLATLAVTMVLIFAGSACGNDDTASDQLSAESVTEESAEENAADGTAARDVEAQEDGGADGGAAESGGLVAPLDYLQGDWCDSQGIVWIVDGSEVRYGPSADNLSPPTPVKAFLSETPAMSLVSQEDEAFVVDQLGREVTFTRGTC